MLKLCFVLLYNYVLLYFTLHVNMTIHLSVSVYDIATYIIVSFYNYNYFTVGKYTVSHHN